MPSPCPSDDLHAGQRFGNYVIGDCIGRGGMARVYRAKHVGLGKVVALKVMERERVDDPRWRARFEHEAKSAVVVKHPHIVDVTDVGLEGNVPFIVMEYLVGVDLGAHLAEVGRITETAMADLLLPIVAGLGFAHDAGVVHRDIKPSNIFLAHCPDGSVVPKLLDFGIAKTSFLPDERGMQTDTGQIIGTPMFMAPEALDGARYLTDRSDQYSLGLVLYQCLTGRPPFDEQTPSSLLRSIATGRLQLLRSLRLGASRTVEKLVARTLEIDPARRFSHVREVGSILFTLASPRTRVLWESTFGSNVTGTRRTPIDFAGHVGTRARPMRRVAAVLGTVLLACATMASVYRLERHVDAPVSRPHERSNGVIPGSSSAALAGGIGTPQLGPTTVSVVLGEEHEGGPAGSGGGKSAPASAPRSSVSRARASAPPGEPVSKRGTASTPPSARGERDTSSTVEQSELQELFPGIGDPAAPKPSVGGAQQAGPAIPE